MAVPRPPASNTSHSPSSGRPSSNMLLDTAQQQMYLRYLEAETNTVIGYDEDMLTTPEYQPLKAHVERLLETSQANAQNYELSPLAGDMPVEATVLSAKRAAAVRAAYTFVNSRDAIFLEEGASHWLFGDLFETHCDSYSVVQDTFRISPGVLARLMFDTSSNGMCAAQPDLVVGLNPKEIFIPDGSEGATLSTAAKVVGLLSDIVIPTLTGGDIPTQRTVVAIGMYHYIAMQAKGGNGSVAKARLQLYTAMRVLCAQFQNLYDTAVSMDPACEPIPESLKYVYGITTVAETWSVFCMWMGPTGHIVVPIDHINVQRPRGMQEFLSLFRTIISTGQERAAYIGHLLERLLVAERQRRALMSPFPPPDLQPHPHPSSSSLDSGDSNQGGPPPKRSRLHTGTEQQTQANDNAAGTHSIATAISVLEPSLEPLGADSSLRSRSALECKVESWRRHLSPEKQT